MGIVHMNTGKAQVVIGELLGLLTIATIVLLTAATALGAAISLEFVLVSLLAFAVPPAAALGLLFAGRRRTAAIVAFLGALTCVGAFLFIASLGSAGSWSALLAHALPAICGLPFLGAGIILAKTSSGLLVKPEGSRQVLLAAPGDSAQPRLGEAPGPHA